jgi:hypothetical protein
MGRTSQNLVYVSADSEGEVESVPVEVERREERKEKKNEALGCLIKGLMIRLFPPKNGQKGTEKKGWCFVSREERSTTTGKTTLRRSESEKAEASV